MSVELRADFITPARRQMIFLAERDGEWQCRYCGVLLQDWSKPFEDRDDFDLPAPTRDHVIPRRAGGSNDLSNLVLACSSCNARKGIKFWPVVPLEWMSL